MFLEKTVVYIFSKTNTFKSVWKGKENRKPLHLKEIWKRLHTVYQWWPPGYKTSLSSKFFLQGLLSLLHVPWLFALTSKVIVIIWKPNVCIYMHLKKKKSKHILVKCEFRTQAYLLLIEKLFSFSEKKVSSSIPKPILHKIQLKS